MRAAYTSEAQFQKAVIELAHRLGWRVAHFRTSQNSRGQYMTAVQADGAGFPDLVLVRDRVIFAELKTAGKQLSTPQVEWAEAIHKASGEFYCWKPKDWDEIELTLRCESSINTPYGDAA
jgi:hypothetical protein